LLSVPFLPVTAENIRATHGESALALDLILFIFFEWLCISDVLRDFNDGDVSYAEVRHLPIFVCKTNETVRQAISSGPADLSLCDI